MADAEKVTVPILVQPLTGQAVSEKHTYLPIQIDLLRAGRSLQFDLYRRTDDNKLVLFHSKDQIIPPGMQEQIRAEKLEGRLYLRGDHYDDLLEYQEGTLLEILGDDKVRIESKCEIVKNLTTSLSQQMFQNPTAVNISRQRRNIFRLVDFSMKDDLAMKGLLRLAHHDYYTYTHSVNVGLYGLSIAIAHFGQDHDHNLHEMVAAFFLHDIGKCRVKSEIINKPGPLDETEWIEIKKHPNYGFLILERDKLLSDETRIVVTQHHERIDGMGYPSGLRASDVHPYARICSIADAFDALTSRRAYRSAKSPFEALKIMKQDMSAQFDSTFFRIFVLQLQEGRHNPSRLVVAS